jgi:acetylornithine deacetylase/succinyl-diaminopimelate desuccinylase-like protein
MSVPEIAKSAASKSFRDYMVNLLVEVCAVDTSIRADVAALRSAEAKVAGILERELIGFKLPNAKVQPQPITPAIGKHPFFSNLYYTKSAANPQGMSVEETYKDRFNLLLLVDGDGKRGAGMNQAVNVHIDVVAPYIPPRVEGDKVFGRGACDDKGPAIALVGALKLISEYLAAKGIKLNKHFTGMWVIEEEMGGNGSLTAALDKSLKQRYDSLVVLECCESELFPGNRGCVWYKVEGSKPGANLFEAAAYIIEELEKEGRSIRSESDHALFPHRPVQTCHGIFGGSGKHPSGINGDVSFDIVIDGGDIAAAKKIIGDVIAFALQDYLGLYGDKTKVIDKGTGKPKVDHHFDLTATDFGYTVRVFGSTGHMGSIFENDGAITKMAHFVRGLIRSRAMIAQQAGAKGVTYRQSLKDADSVEQLLLEGGQGFLPTHEMNDIMARMRRAVARGADTYFRTAGVSASGDEVFNTTFDKLHNAAFAGPPDSTEMKHALASAKDAGIARGDKPIRGWDVSCDARIFACEYPDMQVITTGPGSLQFAHSDHEHIDIPEMLRFAEFLAYYILRQTGTIDA